MATTIYDNMPVSEIRSSARLAAQLVLDSVWDQQLPVDPIALSNKLDIDVFTAQLGDDVYGMIQGKPSEAQIYLDVDQSEERMRFTCAHELGHFVERSSRLVNDDGEYAEIDRRSDKDTGKGIEVFANEFAASLLMPEDEVRTLHKSGESRFTMAKIFRVSAAAMGWRLVHLGLA